MFTFSHQVKFGLACRETSASRPADKACVSNGEWSWRDRIKSKAPRKWICNTYRAGIRFLRPDFIRRQLKSDTADRIFNLFYFTLFLSYVCLNRGRGASSIIRFFADCFNMSNIATQVLTQAAHAHMQLTAPSAADNTHLQALVRGDRSGKLFLQGIPNFSDPFK